MHDAPELHFAGAHGDDATDLTLDRNYFAIVGKLGVLDQKKTFRQFVQQRKSWSMPSTTTAPDTANDLIIDKAVRVRVVPEQAGTLSAGCWDAHLVLERFTWVNVDEYVVVVALRRHAHAVKVQVRRGIRTGADRAEVTGLIQLGTICQIVAEFDPYRIAETRS